MGGCCYWRLRCSAPGCGCDATDPARPATTSLLPRSPLCAAGSMQGRPAGPPLPLLPLLLHCLQAEEAKEELERLAELNKLRAEVAFNSALAGGAPAGAGWGPGWGKLQRGGAQRDCRPQRRPLTAVPAPLFFPLPLPQTSTARRMNSKSSCGAAGRRARRRSGNRSSGRRGWRRRGPRARQGAAGRQRGGGSQEGPVVPAAPHPIPPHSIRSKQATSQCFLLSEPPLPCSSSSLSTRRTRSGPWA